MDRPVQQVLQTIHGLESEEVVSVDDLHRFRAETDIGTPVTITVLQGKERWDIIVTPAEAPD